MEGGELVSGVKVGPGGVFGLGKTWLPLKPAREPSASEVSLARAAELRDRSPKRLTIPVRASFVRGSAEAAAPLARLVARRGRGGATPLKLYLGLIWLSSAEPFDSQISARRWAELLDLSQPATLGARRITSAMDILAELRLVALDKARGDATRVTLREESGRDRPYTAPSRQYALAAEEEKSGHRYFQLPCSLWTGGYVQSLSAAGVAMLMAVASEYRPAAEPVWWSTRRFPETFHLSPTMRAAGTRELQDLGLLQVSRTLIESGAPRSFGPERVRSQYRLTDVARATSPAPRVPKRARRSVAVDPGSA